MVTKVEEWGRLADGTAVHRWTLERTDAPLPVRVRILTYGGVVQSVEFPDRHGTPANAVLGFDGPAGYEAHPEPYFGALVGRYANRIAHGAFTLDGRAYRPARNGGPHSLHGGPRGFDKRVWSASATGAGDGVRLTRVSPDGRRASRTPGGVGDVHARRRGRAVHRVRGGDGRPDGGEPDKPHLLEPGDPRPELRVAAAHHTPLDATGVPTGGTAPVAGTRLDFRTRREAGTGLDHNFVLDAPGRARARRRRELYAPATGRRVTVWTTEPGLQVYAPDHLDGVALETQHFPDSPNRPEFPSTVLRPGEVFRSMTRYGFGVVLDDRD